MRLTENQFFGLKRDMPSILKEGSIYLCIDTKEMYIYIEGDIPFKLVEGEKDIIIRDELELAIANIPLNSMQDTYNQSTQSQIVTTAEKGALRIKRGSNSDSDSVIEISNSIDIVTTRINALGLLELISPIDNTSQIILKFPAGENLDKTGILFKGNDGTFNINYSEIVGGVENWSGDDGYFGIRVAKATVLSEKFRFTSKGTAEIGTGFIGTSGTLENGMIVQGYAGFGTNQPLANVHVKDSTTAAYIRLQGINDGDNFGALELWNGDGSSKWQFAHKSVVGETKDFAFVHFNGTSWSVPLTLKDNGEIILNGPTSLKSYTVATLPITSVLSYATVTDAISPTYLGVLTGGGTVKCPVFYNGTNWVSH